jgi:hypothetical protein
MAVCGAAGAAGFRDLPGPSQRALSQIAGPIVWTGSTFLTVWSEYDGVRQTGDVLAARVDSDGNPMGSSIVVGSSDWAPNPALASGGSTLIVVWATRSSIVARRFAADGSALDSMPLMLANVDFAIDFAVAGNGSDDFLVAWPDGRQLGGALVSAGGAVSAIPMLNVPMLGTTTVTRQSSPSIAWNGSQFLVASTVTNAVPICFGCPAPTRVEIIRISAAGTPIDATNTLLSTDSQVVLSSDRMDFLAIGTRGGVAEDSVLTSYQVHSTAGGISVDGPVQLLDWPWSLSVPRVAWDGSSYRVAWEEAGAGSAGGAIVARRLTRQGLPEPEMRGIPYGMHAATPTGAAADSSGRVLVTALRWEQDSPSLSTTHVSLWQPADETTLAPAPPAPVNAQLVQLANCWTSIWWDDPSNSAVAFWVDSDQPRTIGGDVINAPLIAIGRQMALYHCAGTATHPIRVRAWNYGGISQPSEPAKLVTATSRRRATR